MGTTLTDSGGASGEAVRVFTASDGKLKAEVPMSLVAEILGGEFRDQGDAEWIVGRG
jgi:hypothetical protein